MADTIAITFTKASPTFSLSPVAPTELPVSLAEAVIGVSGQPGIKGDTGDIGPTGNDGADGSPGDPTLLIDDITAATNRAYSSSKLNTLLDTKVDALAGKGLSTLTKEYVSAEIAVPANATGTLTHGLGATPKSVFLSVICKTADIGYFVGEEAILGSVFTGVDAGTNVGIQTASNATTLRYKVATVGVAVMNMTTGVPVLITPANWRLIIRAYA